MTEEMTNIDQHRSSIDKAKTRLRRLRNGSIVVGSTAVEPSTESNEPDSTADSAMSDWTQFAQGRNVRIIPNTEADRGLDESTTQNTSESNVIPIDP